MVKISKESTEPIDVPVTAPTDPIGLAVAMNFVDDASDPGDTWVSGSWVGTWDAAKKTLKARATISAASLSAGVYWVFVRVGGVGGVIIRSGQIVIY